MKMDRTKALLICSNYFKTHTGEVAEAVEMLAAMCKQDRREVLLYKKQLSNLEKEKEILVKRYTKDGTLVDTKHCGYFFSEARRRAECWERMYPEDRITMVLNTIENDIR